MTEVPRLHTQPTTEEWRDAMLVAAARLGISLDDHALSVLWAQWALETGRGKSCFNNNLGNIKHVEGDGRDWMWLDTFEYFHGVRTNMPDKFRAFATLAEGAYDYLQFLCRPVYSLPWGFVLAGDGDGFARALKAKDYYTGPVEDYARNLRSLAAEYMRAASRERDTDPAPAPEEPVTEPGVPVAIRRSSQRIAAVNAPIIDADTGNAVAPIRAGAGEKEYVP